MKCLPGIFLGYDFAGADHLGIAVVLRDQAQQPQSPMPICSLNLHQGSQSEGGFVPTLAVMWSGKSQGQEVGRLVGWFLVLFV